jgi:Tfp pilus assembly protein PilE
MKLPQTLVVAAAVVAAFVVGFVTYPQYQHYHQRQVIDASKLFVGDLVAGNNAAAYALSSSNIQSKQTADQFNASMGDLKSSEPQYSGEEVALGKTNATYSVTVNNLPADGVGSTNGTFQLGLVKQSGKWVVDSVSVQ